jgi:uncharacterized membrane protein YoaK (UPF0700 family)
LTRYDLRNRALAVSLSAIAGYVDALGFIGTGGYFLSFMSGNSTRFAVGFGEGISYVMVPLGLILFFVLGVMVSTGVGKINTRLKRPMILGFFSATLAVAALLFGLDMPVAGFAVTAFAMGGVNTVFEENGEVRIGLTYMTGTLVKLGQRLVAALTGRDKWGWFAYFTLWFGLASGAIAGALSFAYWGMQGISFASVMAAVLAIIAYRMEAQVREPGCHDS